MEFEGLAAARYSLRKFAKTPVEQEKIDSILAVCRLAPTACNNQPQRILVLTQPQALEKLKACTSSHFNAPLAMIVCYDKTEAWVRDFDGASSGEIDASIVGTHLTLQAANLGLGSTWVMHFDPAAVRREFNLPASVVPVAIFPIGYPALLARPAHLHEKRRPVVQTTVYESF